MNAADPLLYLSVSIDYAGKPGVLRNATLDIQPGEIMGLVGQSGSGKSTLALAIIRLHNPNVRVSGTIFFQGRELMDLSESEMRAIRGREIGLVLQSPISSLNPSLRIGTQLMEAWRAHNDGPKDKATDYLKDVLRSVSLPDDDDLLRRYPRHLSVGMAQRVLIAMAILHRPALLIADEPTSALDEITQSEILQLFARLSRGLRMAILYISHDLLSVASLCQRIAILHEGEIVECAAAQQIFQRPTHAYTRRLVDALPRTPS